MIRKVIVCLSLIFGLMGCNNKYEEWQIPLNNIQSVMITDYNYNNYELSKDDYTNIIEIYNSIENISYNEHFSDGSVYGRSMFNINIQYIDKQIVLGIYDLGFISVWDKESKHANYYNVDIFEKFNDEFRNLLIKNNIEITNLRGFVIEDSYIQLPFSNHQDYVVSGSMNIKELYKLIEIEDIHLDDNMTVSDFLLTRLSNPKCNDEIEIDKFDFKIINVEEDKILGCYVRVVGL